MEIDGREYVITNRHVVDDAPLASVKIKLADGRILFPTSKWDDQETDIAVLHVICELIDAALYPPEG